MLAHWRWMLVGLFGLTFLMPGTGWAVDLCPIHRMTHLPCPGCGLSRAMSLVSHGDLLTALGANPFVVFAWPLLLVLTAVALMPVGVRARFDLAITAREPAFNRVAMVLFYAFIGFGALRFVILLALGIPFP